MKMRIGIIFPFVLIAAYLCSSCASSLNNLSAPGGAAGQKFQMLKQAGSQVSEGSQGFMRIENGINMRLKCDEKLNWHYEKPHALVLCAYQLKDLNGFRQTLEEKNGMAKLMECSRYDSSVNYVKRIVAQPGKEISVTMDLFEGTKNVAVIAGYYHFKKNQAVRSFELPLKGVFSRKPSGMDINLYLSSNDIQEINKD